VPITERTLEQLGFNGDFGKMQFANGRDVQFESYDNMYNGKCSRKFRVSGDAPPSEPAGADVVREANARWRVNHPAKPAGRPAAPPAKATVLPPVGPTPPDDGSTWDPNEAKTDGIPV
jgi:hypothetical protein